MTLPQIRIGEGHDTHRLGSERKLILGGVEIPHRLGAIGHSDADVLFHSITDALLGAIAGGDIGELFPDTDPAHENADSEIFLQAAVERIQAEGWTVLNVDCTIFAQAPKLSEWKQTIRENIARVLQVELSQINVKAKTGERVGPIGREEAIGASASVLLGKPETGE